MMKIITLKNCSKNLTKDKDKNYNAFKNNNSRNIRTRYK